ncbi:hypothetical protein FRB93_004708 [Tulasnella sp. JGI-2019a]|nr:hypothetical protein FRB93_004708 [Tulasnella sp. JGI-2019a]
MPSRVPPPKLVPWAPFDSLPILKHSSTSAEIVLLLSLATTYLAVPPGTKPLSPDPLGSSRATKLAKAIYELALRRYQAEADLLLLGACRCNCTMSEPLDTRLQPETSASLEGTDIALEGRSEMLPARDSNGDGTESRSKYAESDYRSRRGLVLPKFTAVSVASFSELATHGTAITKSPPSLASLAFVVDKAKRLLELNVDTTTATATPETIADDPHQDEPPQTPVWQEIVTAAALGSPRGGNGAAHLRTILKRSSNKRFDIPRSPPVNSSTVDAAQPIVEEGKGSEDPLIDFSTRLTDSGVDAPYSIPGRHTHTRSSVKNSPYHSPPVYQHLIQIPRPDKAFPEESDDALQLRYASVRRRRAPQDILSKKSPLPRYQHLASSLGDYDQYVPRSYWNRSVSALASTTEEDDHVHYVANLMKGIVR